MEERETRAHLQLGFGGLNSVGSTLAAVASSSWLCTKA